MIAWYYVDDDLLYIGQFGAGRSASVDVVSLRHDIIVVVVFFQHVSECRRWRYDDVGLWRFVRDRLLGVQHCPIWKFARSHSRRFANCYLSRLLFRQEIRLVNIFYYYVIVEVIPSLSVLSLRTRDITWILCNGLPAFTFKAHLIIFTFSPLTRRP